MHKVLTENENLFSFLERKKKKDKEKKHRTKSQKYTKSRREVNRFASFSFHCDIMVFFIFIFQLRQYPYNITRDIFILYTTDIFRTKMIYHRYFLNMNASSAGKTSRFMTQST